MSLLLRFGGFVRGPLWAIEFVLESIKTHIIKLMVVLWVRFWKVSRVGQIPRGPPMGD